MNRPSLHLPFLDGGTFVCAMFGEEKGGWTIPVVVAGTVFTIGAVAEPISITRTSFGAVEEDLVTGVLQH